MEYQQTQEQDQNTMTAIREDPTEQLATDIDILRAMQPIKAKGVNFDEYEGMKVKIAKVFVRTFPAKYANDRMDRAICVQSAPIVSYTSADGKVTDFCASELFNSSSDTVNGIEVFGWPENGKMAEFLQKHKVTHPLALIGKTVVVVVKLHKTQKDDRGEAKKFFGFTK